MATGTIKSDMQAVTVSTGENITFNGNALQDGHMLVIAGTITVSAQLSAYSTVFTLPSETLTSANFPLFGQYYALLPSVNNQTVTLYSDINTRSVRLGGGALATGTYRIYCTLLVK